MIKYQLDKSGLNQLTIKLSKVRNLQPVLKEIGQNLEHQQKIDSTKEKTLKTINGNHQKGY